MSGKKCISIFKLSLIHISTVDSGKVAAPTLDGLWADADGDGMGDYSDALKSNAVSHAVLYDLDAVSYTHLSSRSRTASRRTRPSTAWSPPSSTT